MEIKEITCLIENFVPLELQESWDCSGFQIDLGPKNIKNVLLCLSITENIINQAIEKHCDMIIAHHPLFFVPLGFNKNISIYSAHTNLDKADGGTTDTLIKLLDLENLQKVGGQNNSDFLRIIELKEEISLNNFNNLLKNKLNLKNIRVVNNLNQQVIKKVAFCAGSGSDFLNEAKEFGADAFVTGDVKYHTALDSDVIIIDIGHFESEYPVLKTIENLLKPLNIGVIIADEKSPFINY